MATGHCHGDPFLIPVPVATEIPSVTIVEAMAIPPHRHPIGHVTATRSVLVAM